MIGIFWAMVVSYIIAIVWTSLMYETTDNGNKTMATIVAMLFWGFVYWIAATEIPLK